MAAVDQEHLLDNERRRAMVRPGVEMGQALPPVVNGSAGCGMRRSFEAPDNPISQSVRLTQRAEIRGSAFVDRAYNPGKSTSVAKEFP